MEEIFEAAYASADAGLLRALAGVNRSTRRAALPRLRPLEHFELRVTSVPESIHAGETATFLYELTGVGVHLLADAKHFRWGDAGGAWHTFEALPLLPPSPSLSVRVRERGSVSHHEVEEEAEAYVCPKQDGRVDSFEEIPQQDMVILKHARVLDVNYPVDRAEAFLTSRLQPRLDTVRFVTVPPPKEMLVFPLPARRVVYFDNPGLWIRPGYHAADFDLCSDMTSKLVIHEKCRQHRKDAIFLPLPQTPSKRLKDITCFLPRWETPLSGYRYFEPCIWLAVWAVMHGVRVAMVGAWDVEPAVLRGGGPGNSVRYIQSRIEAFARSCSSDNGVESRLRDVTFVTRDEYRDIIGQEDFDIETDVDYYKHRGSSLV